MIDLNVSRETLDRLTTYHDLIQKWSPKINLVSKSSILDLWNRHISDSTQVYRLSPHVNHWVDMGSGGGLPGLVVAILAKEDHPETQVTLIESDARKSVFLRTVIRELDLNAVVSTARIEELEPQQADVLSARALADLSRLLSFAERHLSQDGTALFYKGETWPKEVQTARESWSFDLVAHTSKTHEKGAILEVRDIQRV
ncbi:ribosomal RNA small subunit methyltransferase G [Roseobacter cerasinus]|uniref:Ribosomal RNA small subunit methyltransferase G n=1 Tax=Roseobacter cerasinus TaxID=2602289 RepID=A0A640VM93_9RHOB|nr:ribosomal RNA small subunit methyltransferase G [Roseobacter cerasinus]